MIKVVMYSTFVKVYTLLHENCSQYSCLRAVYIKCLGLDHLFHVIYFKYEGTAVFFQYVLKQDVKN